MYKSVLDFFTAEHVDLVRLLDVPSDFWSRVKDNSFTNAEIENILQQDIILNNRFRTHLATVALKEGRQQGKIHDPV